MKAGPNPFTSQLAIYYTAADINSVQVSLTDVYGRQLRSIKSNIVGGDNKIILDGLSRLTSGVYFLLVSNADGTERSLFKVQKSK